MFGKRKAPTYKPPINQPPHGADVIRCVIYECGAYRWAIPPNPINWDGTWRETTVGWVCPDHVREAHATNEATRPRTGDPVTIHVTIQGETFPVDAVITRIDTDPRTRQPRIHAKPTGSHTTFTRTQWETP